MCRLIMGHKSVAIQEVSVELGVLFTPFQKFSHGICPVSKVVNVEPFDVINTLSCALFYHLLVLVRSTYFYKSGGRSGGKHVTWDFLRSFSDVQPWDLPCHNVVNIDSP